MTLRIPERIIDTRRIQFFRGKRYYTLRLHSSFLLTLTYFVAFQGIMPFPSESSTTSTAFLSARREAVRLDVAGPTTDNLGVCPAGRECTITGAA